MKTEFGDKPFEKNHKKIGVITMSRQKPRKADDLQNQLTDLKDKFRKALPEEVYTKFETITLKFTAAHGIQEAKYSDSGLWKDGDVKEVSYLDGIQMMTRRYRLNFSQVGMPKEARYGIGILLHQIPTLLVSRFTEAHRQFCDAWLELESLIKSTARINVSIPSLAFCIYEPEKGNDPHREASYKDWVHLRNEVIGSLEAIKRLEDWLKEKAKRASSKKRVSDSEPQSYAKRPATKKRYKEMIRLVNEEVDKQENIGSPVDRFPLKAIFEKVAKKVGVSPRTIRRAWRG
jgi:hypothetical protein